MSWVGRGDFHIHGHFAARGEHHVYLQDVLQVDGRDCWFRDVRELAAFAHVALLVVQEEGRRNRNSGPRPGLAKNTCIHNTPAGI